MSFPHGVRGTSNRDWWPNTLPLELLHQHSTKSDPMGKDFDYAKAFKSLDYQALKKDLRKLMTDSKPWWPADFGHYGPLFVRMAWHSAGTYRTGDGRGGGGRGQQRYAPLNSWPDNASLDKARRLLWPIKQKYGSAISWADLMILTGNVALESMGFKTFGFGGGRKDVWEPDQDVYWGAENKWLGADQRYSGERDLANPLAAVQMGLIYVNPEGPDGKPDPVAAARDIRETFGRMAMNDEETVALIAGGHSFGKTHGAGDAAHVGANPEAADLEAQGLGWSSKHGTGIAGDAITSGLEVTWTRTPAKFSNDFFKHLFEFEWELTRSPAGAHQWRPKNGAGAGTVPNAYDKSKTIAPGMLTTDLALRFDPAYEKISRRFHEHPDQFADAFARAWFKLTHRDMGPRVRYLGPEIPKEELIWQDPLPKAGQAHPWSTRKIAALKKVIAGFRASPCRDLVSTAWASASTFRGSGHARRRQRRAHPPRAAEGLGGQPAGQAGESPRRATRRIQIGVQRAIGQQKVSLADLIVLGGVAGDRDRRPRPACQGEGAVHAGPHGRHRRSRPTCDSFKLLEPAADGFRNYLGANTPSPPEERCWSIAPSCLTLTAPEMTVLVGGLRVLGANVGRSKHGVFTEQAGARWATTSSSTCSTWRPVEAGRRRHYEGRDRKSGAVKWTATRVDLIFGSHSQLRALAEVYAQSDARGEVREGLRRRLDEGDGSRPLRRPRLIGVT